MDRLVPGLSADDVSPALAAIDALARLEFARTPDPRYATLLRDVANALASDDDVRSARLARATMEKRKATRSARVSFFLTRAAESLGGAERRRRARWRLAAGADGIRYRFR